MNLLAEEGLDFLAFGEGNFVAGYKEILVHAAESIFNEYVIFVTAEKEADGWA